MGLLVLRAGARRARRLLLLTACIALGGVAVPAVADAAPPSTLSGEQFTSLATAVVGCQQGGSFSFTASGTATGPYSGTFTETGDGTVANPSGSVLPPVTALTASFTVRSPSGAVLVTGTKALSAPGGGGCLDTLGNFIVVGPVHTTYQATIHTPTGNYADNETSDIGVLSGGPNEPGMGLLENFASSLTQPVLISPTSKDQCKHGGWMNFPQFKNQGDCMSFVATDGKNPPSGS